MKPNQSASFATRRGGAGGEEEDDAFEPNGLLKDGNSLRVPALHERRHACGGRLFARASRTYKRGPQRHRCQRRAGYRW